MNIPDLYPDDADIDPTSYCLLLRIRSLDKVWKRRLYRRINEWRSEDACPINITEPVSLQTVCRRVDRLEEKDLVNCQPQYSEKLQQYIDCYTLTDKGEKAIQETKQTIIDRLIVKFVHATILSRSLEIEDGVFEKLSQEPYSAPFKDREELEEHAAAQLA